MTKTQEELGGDLAQFQPPKIKAIEEAALEHRANVAKRLKRQEIEEESADALQKVLHKHEDKLTIKDKDGNPGYVFSDGDETLIAVLKRTEEKVSVRRWTMPKKKKEEKAADE